MKPRPHQAEALEAIRGIGPAGRGLVVMACGTGKTLVGRLAALERAGSDGLVMLLVPSKELLRQTYEDWQRDVPGGVDGLLVYSDQSVGAARATTDPEDIAAFLRTRTGRVRLLLCTYQSAVRVAEAYDQFPGLPVLDVMVLDEAHRTAGPAARAFQVVLDDSRIPAGVRISLTATTRVHASEDGTQDAVSMDDPEKYGPLLHELTFGDAIGKGLLSDFRVAIVMVSDADIRDLLQRQAASRRAHELTASQMAVQIAVSRAVEEYGLRRVIAFHGRVDRSRVFCESLPSTASAVMAVPLEALHVVGTTPAGARRAALDRLANPAAGGATVLSNVAVLTEGVDVPAVDSVVFADPKTSKIAIAQAVGRALRLHPGKDQPSVIVLPVYLAPGESPEEVLSSSDFRHVWAVLASLRDFDERLDAEFSTARINAGEIEFEGREESIELPKAIDFLGAGVELQERLHEALKLHVLNNTTESWLSRYGQLKAYVEFTGELPRTGYVSPQGTALGRFCNDQKTNYRKGRMLPSRVALLESLPGWDWGTLRANYDGFDGEALIALADEWNVLLRLDVSDRSEAMEETAYKCHELMPDFKYPASRFRAYVNNAVTHMQAVYIRAEKKKELEKYTPLNTGVKCPDCPEGTFGWVSWADARGYHGGYWRCRRCERNYDPDSAVIGPGTIWAVQNGKVRVVRTR